MVNKKLQSRIILLVDSIFKRHKEKNIKLQPPLESQMAGCFNCGYTEGILPMETELYNDYGGWEIRKDSKCYYQKDNDDDNFKCATLADIEADVKKDPNHNWTAFLNLPLRSATYQRQGDDKWVLIEVGKGFA